MNRLGEESSPYLRQHRDNPVDWHAWGPEAFAEARRRDVPVLLSIGYSSCHWCHVMARESFEDPEVAAAMNARFVNIKVDREERPDVDSIYMDAVQALTGRGGWPLTAFLNPEGAPFHAGTYYPKAQFLQLLGAVDDVWRTRRDDLQQNVAAIGNALTATSRMAPAAELPGLDHLNRALGTLITNFDAEWGGFGQAPKFPSTMSLDLVLRAHHQQPTDEARTIVTTTLDAMASGGMYDHLGGGFARYSVDRQWVVPHFEKMLSDQALLVRTYTRAALALGVERWRQVVEETVEYVMRELRHPGGGFYSAEDADSPAVAGDPHGHEGLFYTWTPDEVRAVLGDDAALALEWYEMTGPANFTEPGHSPRWIPVRLRHRGDWQRPADVEGLRHRLFEHRATRPRPGLDDKVLTEWNGLMLSALAEAAAAFDRPDWAGAAEANGEFLWAELRTPDGRWLRSWHADGAPRARHMALAADHAALVDAFTRMSELTGQARWLDAAMEVADTLLDHFWDTDRGGLYTTADDAEALVVRQKDLTDGATPAANSAAAWSLLRLAALTGEARYAHQADQILRLVGTVATKAPTAVCLALAAADLRRQGTTEVVIAGERPDLVRAARSRWLPNGVLAWGERTSSPLWEDRGDGQAYVCQNFACQLPVDTVPELLAQLD